MCTLYYYTFPHCVLKPTMFLTGWSLPRPAKQTHQQIQPPDRQVCVQTPSYSPLTQCSSVSICQYLPVYKSYTIIIIIIHCTCIYIHTRVYACIWCVPHHILYVYRYMSRYIHYGEHDRPGSQDTWSGPRECQEG